MHSFRVDIGEIEIDADVGLRHLFDLQQRRVSYVHSFPSKLCLVQLQVFPDLSILTWIFLAGPPASNIKPELHWLHHDTLIGLKVLIFAFFHYIQFLNYFPFFQLFSILQLFPIFSIISHFSIISPKSKLSYNLSHTADAPLVQKFSVF